MRKSDDDKNRRVSRVEQEIQKTVAQFLIAGFSSRLPGLVTVSRVLMPADLRSAKVYVSVLGSEEQREIALETLQDRAFEIQDFIGKQLKMRYCPKLTFFHDDTTEHVLKIDRILHELEEKRQAEQKKSRSNDEE